MVRGAQHQYRLPLCPAGAGLAERTEELIALRPEVIVAHTTPVASALRSKTRSIPIVFVNVSDPIGAGLVSSFARPGGNATTRAASFNHLVSAGDERWGNRKAECFGGFEVDDQQEFGWKGYRQIGRLGTFKNFVDIDRALASQRDVS